MIAGFVELLVQPLEHHFQNEHHQHVNGNLAR